MFEWIKNVIVGAAYDAAIYSADTASYFGMHQMKEPANLQELAKKDAE